MRQRRRVMTRERISQKLSALYTWLRLIVRKSVYRRAGLSDFPLKPPRQIYVVATATLTTACSIERHANIFLALYISHWQAPYFLYMGVIRPRHDEQSSVRCRLIDREFMRHRGIEFSWAAPRNESCNWRNNDAVAWARVESMAVIGESVTYAWPTPSDSIAGRFSCAPEIFYTGVGVTLFPVCFFSSRDREINRSKSETRAARIRISFVGRFDLWKLVSIFFLPAERITLLAARNSNQSVSRTYYSTPPQSLAAQVRCNVERLRCRSRCLIRDEFLLLIGY